MPYLHSICMSALLFAMFIISFIMKMCLSIHRENRYLLFLTENYAALRILHHYLHDAVHISPAKSRDHTDEQSDTLSLAHMEPFVLFGSSFPRDKEYTQVCWSVLSQSGLRLVSHHTFCLLPWPIMCCHGWSFWLIIYYMTMPTN